MINKINPKLTNKKINLSKKIDLKKQKYIQEKRSLDKKGIEKCKKLLRKEIQFICKKYKSVNLKNNVIKKIYKLIKNKVIFFWAVKLSIWNYKKKYKTGNLAKIWFKILKKKYAKKYSIIVRNLNLIEYLIETKIIQEAKPKKIYIFFIYFLIKDMGNAVSSKLTLNYYEKVIETVKQLLNNEVCWGIQIKDEKKLMREKRYKVSEYASILKNILISFLEAEKKEWYIRKVTGHSSKHWVNNFKFWEYVYNKISLLEPLNLSEFRSLDYKRFNWEMWEEYLKTKYYLGDSIKELFWDKSNEKNGYKIYLFLLETYPTLKKNIEIKYHKYINDYLIEKKLIKESVNIKSITLEYLKDKVLLETEKIRKDWVWKKKASGLLYKSFEEERNFNEKLRTRYIYYPLKEYVTEKTKELKDGFVKAYYENIEELINKEYIDNKWSTKYENSKDKYIIIKKPQNKSYKLKPYWIFQMKCIYYIYDKRLDTQITLYYKNYLNTTKYIKTKLLEMSKQNKKVKISTNRYIYQVCNKRAKQKNINYIKLINSYDEDKKYSDMVKPEFLYSLFNFKTTGEYIVKFNKFVESIKKQKLYGHSTYEIKKQNKTKEGKSWKEIALSKKIQRVYNANQRTIKEVQEYYSERSEKTKHRKILNIIKKKPYLLKKLIKKYKKAKMYFLKKKKKKQKKQKELIHVKVWESKRDSVYEFLRGNEYKLSILQEKNQKKNTQVLNVFESINQECMDDLCLDVSNNLSYLNKKDLCKLFTDV